MRFLIFGLLLLTLISGCTAESTPPSSTNRSVVATNPPSNEMPTEEIAADLATLAAAVQGDAERGAVIFTSGVNGSPPCTSCHALTEGAFTLAPIMQGISERAARRIQGMNAESYLYESIFDPGAYLVPGFRNIMYPQYDRHFNAQDSADLIAYLLTM